MNALLTSEQIDFYRENGFVKVEQILTPGEVAELAQYMDEVMANEEIISTDQVGGGYYRVLFQKAHAWHQHEGIAKFTLSPKLAQMALALTGAKAIRLLDDHILWKMPQDSKETPWHQDASYWPLNEAGALSIWIPVDDVNERNGCMSFIPGSHKAGKLEAIELSNPDDLFTKTTGYDRAKAVKVPLQAGSCTFHDGLAFHYAHANQTDKPRRVLAIIYMPDGTTYSGKPSYLTNDQRKDAPLEGPLFPVLAAR